MNKSKVALTISIIIEKIQLVMGIFHLLLFGMVTLLSFSDKGMMETGAIYFLYFFDALGILLIFLSRRTRKLINNFKKYVSLLSSDPSGSIDLLATVTNTSPDKVRKNLETMIKRKYFVDAYINMETNCIIIRSNMDSVIRQAEDGNYESQQPLHQQQALEYMAVTCKSCGGQNRVTRGQQGECDFCGSPLA